jgi:hypothetical protein
MANTNTDVKLIVLPEELYKYLIFVMEAYCKSGLHPDECFVASELWKRIKNAPQIDFSELGKVKMESMSPNHVAVSLTPEDTVTSKS